MRGDNGSSVGVQRERRMDRPEEGQPKNQPSNATFFVRFFRPTSERSTRKAMPDGPR